MGRTPACLVFIGAKLIAIEKFWKASDCLNLFFRGLEEHPQILNCLSRSGVGQSLIRWWDEV